MRLLAVAAILLGVCSALPTTKQPYVLDLSGRGAVDMGSGPAPQPPRAVPDPDSFSIGPLLVPGPRVDGPALNVGPLLIPGPGVNPTAAPQPGTSAPWNARLPTGRPPASSGNTFGHEGLQAGIGPIIGPEAGPTSVPAPLIDWTCEGYRAHPSNPNMYQVFFNMQWADYSCFGILTWNQTLCSCVIPPDTGNVDPNCPNNRAIPTDPTMYQIKHWGVWLPVAKRCPVNQLWNQTGCRCDWDPIGPGAVVDTPIGGICDLMFNASFTYDLLDDANYNSIGREPWFNVKVENGSARLDNGRMPVWAFASNDFGRAFQIQFNFKLDQNLATAKQYTTLVSNACNYDRPSVGISYRPIDQSYSVYFRDIYAEGTSECTSPSLTPYDFQSVSLEYQYSQLFLKVNGQVCLSSNQFGGDIALSRCPFYLGGDGLMQYMTGNFDQVVVRRFCVSPV